MHIHLHTFCSSHPCLVFPSGGAKRATSVKRATSAPAEGPACGLIESISPGAYIYIYIYTYVCNIIYIYI